MKKNYIFTAASEFFLVCCFMQTSEPALAQDAIEKYETESERFNQVYEIIISTGQKTLEDKYIQPEKLLQCKMILKDFMDKKLFVPVEPIAVISHNYPPSSHEIELDLKEDSVDRAVRLIQEKAVINLIGKKLDSSLRRCAVAEALGDERKAKVLFNGFNDFSGGPPYRIYILPKNSNPFFGSDLLYWSEFLPKLGTGRNGYTWIDLNSCEKTHTSFTPYFTTSLSAKEDPQKAVLTAYPNALIAWTTTDNGGFFADIYNLPYINSEKSRNICSWD